MSSEPGGLQAIAAAWKATTPDRNSPADRVTRPPEPGPLPRQHPPRPGVPYQGTMFEEIFLGAVLARKPALALVDDLAHRNVPGAGHARP